MCYTQETADWARNKHCRTSSRRTPIAPDLYDTRTKSCDAGNRDFRVVSPARTEKGRVHARSVQHLSNKKKEESGREEKKRTARAADLEELNSSRTYQRLRMDEKLSSINQGSFQRIDVCL